MRSARKVRILVADRGDFDAVDEFDALGAYLVQHRESRRTDVDLHLLRVLGITQALGTLPHTDWWGGGLPFGRIPGLLGSIDADETGTVPALAPPDDAERAVSLQDDSKAARRVSVRAG